MFSSSLGRAVRSTCSTPAPSNAPLRPSARSLTAVSKPWCRRSHQRRLSSSKASGPPNGSKPSISSHQAPVTSGRGGRRKSKEPGVITIAGRDQAFSNLPSVPSTSHLHPADVGLSSFFSLHRPISVTTAIPVPSSEASFNTIFEPRSQNNRKANEVIYTLGNVIESIESAGQENAWEQGQDSEGQAIHLDGTPRKAAIDDIMRTFRPFRPPPPPIPFESSQSKSTKRQVSKARSPRTKKKSWSTTLFVTETTGEDGSKIYTAATTPIIQVPEPVPVVNEPERRPKMQQPFLQRMLIRQQEWEQFRQRRLENPSPKQQMLLISVKRQRKLKMKKHKYKKLMRRTRNLRRRLGKI